MDKDGGTNPGKGCQMIKPIYETAHWRGDKYRLDALLPAGTGLPSLCRYDLTPTQPVAFGDL